MSKPAIFFDRDNTIIKDIPYLGDPELVALMPHACDALRLLKKHSFELFIISNQSGVGRGFITKEQVATVNTKMEKLLTIPYFTRIYSCYDDPENPQEYCRKPLPTMILKAKINYDLNLEKSFFVGDRLSDIQAGLNAGCQSILYLTKDHPEEIKEASELAHFSSSDLLEIAEWIIAFSVNWNPR